MLASDYEPIVVSFNLEGDDVEDLERIGSFRCDELIGDAGDDLIIGRSGRDTLEGNAVGDLVFGGLGTDQIFDGEGKDTLEGELSRNAVDGGAGDDKVFGDVGRDHLIGGDGDDAIFGGAGRDTIEGGEGDDELSGGWSRDQFVFSGDFGDDVIADFSRRGEPDIVGVDDGDVTIETDGDDLLITFAGDATFGTIRLDDFDGFLFVQRRAARRLRQERAAC